MYHLGQEMRPMAKSRTVAILSGDAALHNTLGLIAGLRNPIIEHYCARCDRVSNARRFARIFLVDRKKTLTFRVDCVMVRISKLRIVFDWQFGDDVRIRSDWLGRLTCRLLAMATKSTTCVCVVSAIFWDENKRRMA